MEFTVAWTTTGGTKVEQLWTGYVDHDDPDAPPEGLIQLVELIRETSEEAE